jgi:RNA polymerase sigma-70 factor (ECF subfamily)
MHRTHEQIHDELLVLRCQDGDEDALRSLVLRWQSRLLRIARPMVNDVESTRDIVQETWIAAASGLRKLHDPASFPTWIRRIVLNKCTDHVRKRVADRRVKAEIEAQATRQQRQLEGAQDSTEDHRLLIAALAQLPEEQRAILVLHYLDELPIGQIARVLGLAPGTVKSRLFYARDRLKTALERRQS